MLFSYGFCPILSFHRTRDLTPPQIDSTHLDHLLLPWIPTLASEKQLFSSHL
jgi:hypothetical protein